MALASLSAPATRVSAGAALSNASVARTWKLAADCRIARKGARSTRYRCVSWVVADSAWEALATPSKPPARAIEVSTTPSRTMARWGAYHRHGSRTVPLRPGAHGVRYRRCQGVLIRSRRRRLLTAPIGDVTSPLQVRIHFGSLAQCGRGPGRPDPLRSARVYLVGTRARVDVLPPVFVASSPTPWRAGVRFG